VAALRRLLGPVLVLVIDNGRSGRLRAVAGADCRRLVGLSSESFDTAEDGEAATPPGSVGGEVRDRLKAAMNLNAVGGCSTVREGCEPSRLVWSTNATSDKATF
jgi:hypothetical protein